MINQEVEANLKNYSDKNQVILVGMETHACILQTFLYLKSRNYEVFLPADAITSIRSWERTIALQRMQSMGAVLTSVESLSFELLRDYKDEHFKAVAKLLKDTGKRSNAIAHL
jgi:nicotinamidase-related amidase